MNYKKLMSFDDNKWDAHRLIWAIAELRSEDSNALYENCENFIVKVHQQRIYSVLCASYHLVLNEAKVYSGKNPDVSKNLKELICGTFDMLYYYDGDGNENDAGFVILDYKTNASLYSEYNQKKHRTLLPPFDNMIEEDVSLYTIQLSLYALMLEDIGLPIIDRRIVWLMNEGEYKIVSVNDVSELLRKTL